MAAGTDSASIGTSFLGFLFEERATLAPTSIGAAIRTSEDGLAWTRVPESDLPDTGEESGEPMPVNVGGPGFIAVGHRQQARDLDPLVRTSEDGLTWTVAADEAQTLHGPEGR